MRVNVDHKADTPWVGQLPEQNACWLATFAMMEHWFYCTTPTTSQASRDALRKQLKDDNQIQVTGTVLEADIRRIALALGMKVIRAGSVRTLANKLRMSPVAVFGKYMDWNAGGAIKPHVTLIYKMTGSTNDTENLMISGWDPWTASATPYTKDYDTFDPGICSQQDYWVYYETWS